jgi:hypothetical protein
MIMSATAHVACTHLFIRRATNAKKHHGGAEQPDKAPVRLSGRERSTARHTGRYSPKSGRIMLVLRTVAVDPFPLLASILCCSSEVSFGRRETVEHPFGTMKARMGATHFLMKTLPRVASEMALHVLAYNMTRVISIMGVRPLLAAMRA